MKLLYLDLETTGINAKQNGVVQIAGIIEIDGEVKEVFNLKCQPFKGKIVTEEALKITGLTHEIIKTYPFPEQTYQELLAIFKRYIDQYKKEDKFFLIGQNCKFDYDFLNEWFLQNGSKYLYAFIFYGKLDLATITTLMKLAGRINPENLKLETVARYFNIELKAHDALNDINATREIFLRYVSMVKGGAQNITS